MTEIPQIIGGARALKVADIRGMAPTGITRHVVGGRVIERFAGLAIARYDGDSGVYLFYCDAEWTTITDTWHEDVEAAVDQAELEFGPVEFIEIPMLDRQ